MTRLTRTNLPAALLTSLSMCTMAACGASSMAGDIGYESPRPGEVYDMFMENDFIDAAQENTSTFSIDVDTASYTIMRRDVESGTRPDPQSVRPEEYINFFDYDYAAPEQDDPFSINLEVAPSKFGEDKHLLRIGLQGREIDTKDLKPTNLVFLIDVSGSMQSAEKLPLVQESLLALLDNLRDEDTVSIVTYAGTDRVMLEPTPVSRSGKIERAINRLGKWRKGGSTNAEAGIVKAYQLAEDARIEGGNNRVIIATDGDFNVGKTGDDLFDLIEDYRSKGISLTAVGYGLGNFNDYHMENLSNKGNGNYFYVDSIEEAQRIFGSELASTLEVIAADVKIQVEFNHDAVTRYRLIGYENRVLDNQDFDDDSKDAGEIGPGHTVTAYYELELAPQASEQALLSTVRLRYKSQYGQDSQLIERDIKLSQARESFDDATPGFRFGAAVAEFAEHMRQSMHLGQDSTLEVVREVAEAAAPSPDTKQTELLDLVQRASTLPAR